MAKLRKFSAFDDLTSDDEENQALPISLMGAAYDLGRLPSRQQTQQATQQQVPQQNRPSSQASFAGSGVGNPGLSDAERYDQDRINSLDMGLSAAQRATSFMRYRAKYGPVATFGGR